MSSSENALVQESAGGAEPVKPGVGDSAAGQQKILSLPVNVLVSVGGARLTFRDILNLSPDKIIDLDSKVSDPVEVFIGERMIARGDLVEASEENGSLGVRITEIFKDDV